jgi:precorrin-6A synthase
MRRKIMVIGIGAGNPDFITIQAIEAMNRADVFFIPDKGAEKAELRLVRHSIIERHVRNASVRTVEYKVPSRRRDRGSYEEAVAAWHAQIGEAYRRLILEDLGESEIGAFLVWGDPTLYDSTLRVLEDLRLTGGFELEYDVIPGISSVQALAAEHRVPINAIGRAVLVTNGRALEGSLPDNVDSLVVLLNVDKALQTCDGELDAYWGAYVGMPEEILISGKLKDVAADIERVRSAARQKNGWVMDCLMLKKSPHEPAR